MASHVKRNKKKNQPVPKASLSNEEIRKKAEARKK